MLIEHHREAPEARGSRGQGRLGELPDHAPAEWDTKTTDGTIDSWLNGMADYFVSSGKLKGVPAPSDWYTGDLFTSAK